MFLRSSSFSRVKGYDDKLEIVAAAIYTYKGENGKDKRYVYRLREFEEDILVYSFRTMDVEQIKTLVDFLEYLFLIEDSVLESKYEEFKKLQGGYFTKLYKNF